MFRCAIRFAIFGFVALSFAPCMKAQQITTRWMDEINWMEFRDVVPTKTKTVIVTVGTLEPHGVVNNGADNTAPVAIAKAIAADVNAMIAPHIPYGVTGSMAPYPGAMSIPEDAFRGYLRAVLEGMVKNKFKNIIIINGHGGPQTAILNSLASELSLSHNVNTLVINWWSLASDVTLEVFGEDGGHAGINETAFVQAVDPKLLHKERYTGKEMATANPAPGTWSATPFPSAITLYKEGQGWPKDFSQAKADEYFRKVVAKVRGLVQDTLKKWEMAGFN
ncbi:MAG: creatininase family protein [Acidobacteria bacterium]|nr:creatininase family protein [Acidobacteriota bacterium]